MIGEHVAQSPLDRARRAEPLLGRPPRPLEPLVRGALQKVHDSPRWTFHQDGPMSSMNGPPAAR